jgi:hypothetical protein
MLAMAFVLVAGSAMAAVLATDSFSYADGSLVPNGGWATHSGTVGDLLVENGQAVVEHGIPSEDANLVFPASTGTIFFSIEFSVDDLGAPWAGSDSEYFCHFMPSGTFTFMTRVDIVPPSGGGDFSIGLSTATSTAEATWATDLMYGVTYNLVGSYNQDTNMSQLWIDPVGASSPYISGNAGTAPGVVVDAFALRQSDSSLNETIRVDNLIIADACEDVFSTCPSVANEDLSWGAVKALY